jgi:uncharacterized protein YbjT (DUF2867 family)
MARVLIVGGGCRGRELTRELTSAGHTVRVTTRDESGHAAIEAAGGEPFIGTPYRLLTLRSALDRVTVACWMLAQAHGDGVSDLHTLRLEAWLRQVIDTTVRGVIYDADGSVDAQLLADGAAMVRHECQLSSIPYALLEPAADPWLVRARGAIEALIAG